MRGLVDFPVAECCAEANEGKDAKTAAGFFQPIFLYF
jgi:hypothetical protein